MTLRRHVFAWRRLLVYFDLALGAAFEMSHHDGFGLLAALLATLLTWSAWPEAGKHRRITRNALRFSAVLNAVALVAFGFLALNGRV